MATVIEVRELRKTFGSTVALDSLDLQVEEGEVHGFLGPNGSGKTTTIRVLLGLLRRDSGTVRLLGGEPWGSAAELHRHLAYVPGDVALWPNLTGGEVIDLLGRLRGSANGARRDELLERFELDPTKRCRSYSKGNRQKVALVAALASEAPLLILDEPTSGLDPLMDQVFRGYVREASAAGRTVLLSSHILSEVEDLCGRVTIIRAGQTVLSGGLAQMRELSRTAVEASVTSPERAAAELGSVPGVEALEVAGDQVRFSVPPAALSPAVAALGGLGLQSLTSTPLSLEDLFLQMYRTEEVPR